MESETFEGCIVDRTATDAAADVSPVNLVDNRRPKAFDEVSTDVLVRLDVEGDTGVPGTCLEVRDEQCPGECTRDNDADCCEADSICFWSVENSTCGCAVEGPFAPPSLPLRSGALRSAAVA